jgi:hypothetical protein
MAIGLTVGCRASLLFAVPFSAFWPAYSHTLVRVPAITSKRHVIKVRGLADLEHEYQLVPGAIERTHPSVALCPHDQVLEFAVNGFPGGEQLFNVTPVHANEMNGATARPARRMTERSSQKCFKLRRGHLARGHCEITVLDRAQPRRVAVDRDIVRRICEHHVRLVVPPANAHSSPLPWRRRTKARACQATRRRQSGLPE